MIWEELIKVALIGTDRSELSEGTLKALREFGINTDESPANVLLEGATFYAQMRKAGFEPESWEGELPEICPKGDTQICSKKSSDHLAQILNGVYEKALKEFIRYLIHFKKTLPPELLPELLEKCRSDKELWEQLRFAVGDRGYWLIRQNPDWQFLVGKTETGNLAESCGWDTGTKEERIGILKHLRKVDPAEAIKKIESTWEEDDWQFRKAFLGQLENNLSLADEDFLEKCLDDKRKDIRREAACLLALIEGSGLSERMFERVKQCISIKPAPRLRSAPLGVTKVKVEIELPEISDEGMIRDGIDPGKKWSKGGLKASYFAQMFVIVPPSRWVEYFGKEESEVLNTFVRSEWAELLIQATIAATVQWKDENWMEVLVDFYFKNHEKQRWENLNIKPLFEVLPEKLFNQFAGKAMEDLDYPFDNDEPISMLLEINESPWDKKLTLLFMHYLKKIISQNISFSWQYSHYRNILENAGYGTSPNLYEALNKSWSNDEYYWTAWGKEIDVFLQILKFRREVILELKVS